MQNKLLLGLLIAVLSLGAYQAWKDQQKEILVTIHYASEGVELRVDNKILETNTDKEYAFPVGSTFEIYIGNNWSGEAMFEQGIHDAQVEVDGVVYKYRYHMEPR